MKITGDILRAIDPGCRSVKALNAYAEALQAAMLERQIDTVPRAAAFLAQLAWESGHFGYMEEIASGAAYEGRKDLGNTKPGDGLRYKGRGFIQLTGRSNYRAASIALGLDLEGQPHLAADPAIAARVAAWYWDSRSLNAAADRYALREITKRINGACTDLAPSFHPKRERLYVDALAVLGAQP